MVAVTGAKMQGRNGHGIAVIIRQGTRVMAHRTKGSTNMDMAVPKIQEIRGRGMPVNSRQTRVRGIAMLHQREATRVGNVYVVGRLK